MATLSSLRSTIAGDIGRTDTSASPTPSNARIDAAINDAMVEIARRHNFKALLKVHEGSLVEDEIAYSLPTRCKTIFGIRIIDGESSVRLVLYHHRRFDKSNPDPESMSSGKPSAYTLWGNTIYLNYKPDDDYTVRMRFAKWPTPLSGENDSPDFENMDDVVRYGAIVQLYKSKALYGDSIQWDAAFEKVLKDAIKADEESPDWVPMAAEFETEEEGEGRVDDWKNPHRYATEEE